MSFPDEIERAWRHIARIIGKSAVFIPGDGGVEVENVSVILLLGENTKQVGGVSETWESQDTIELWLSDIGREAARGDVFVIDGQPYIVRGVNSNNGYCVQVEVGRND